MSEKTADKAKPKLPVKPAVLLIIGLAAGLIMIIAGSLPSPKGSEAAPVRSETDLTDSYVSTLENRLTLLLEAMDGISGVNVVITPESTVQTQYAVNSRYDGTSLTVKEYVMSDEEGMPVVISLIYPKIRGVAVVCRGGSDPVNRAKVIELISSLLDINSSSVCVVS